jgi:Lipase (class 3).
MSSILDYYEYAKLATAAYINLDGMSLDATTVASQANTQERLPSKLAEQAFIRNPESNPNPWAISSGGYYGNDAEGFAATLFQRTQADGSVEKVLAIRGTEPDFSLTGDLLKADLGQIGFLGLAMGQVVSLVNYVRRLQAGTNTQVQQLELNYSSTQPTGGPSITLPNGKGYIYFTEAPSQAGLGLVNAGEKVTVTGHSLGGHLAALAARLFPELVSDAYTYNAAGFDPETMLKGSASNNFSKGGDEMKDFRKK